MNDLPTSPEVLSWLDQRLSDRLTVFRRRVLRGPCDYLALGLAMSGDVHTAAQALAATPQHLVHLPRLDVDHAFHPAPRTPRSNR